MTEQPSEHTQRVIQRLRQRGYQEHAAKFESVLAGKIGGGLLLALREICQTALTAIEAIDPTTETMLEELRLEVDKRLVQHQTTEPSDPRADLQHPSAPNAEVKDRDKIRGEP